MVVLDDGPIGGGATSRTTAHLSTSLDDGYREYERLHGPEGARLAADSATSAIDAIEGDRGNRDDGRLEARMARLAAMARDAEDLVLFSGSSGLHDLAAREKAFLEGAFPKAALRGYGGLTGHALEAQFPLGLALAALAVDAGAAVPAFNGEGEAAMATPARAAVVTTVGYTRGEGMAHLRANA